MRLGLYPCKLVPGSLAESCYQDELVYERHRHRYEFNNQYREDIEKGLRISGTSPDGRLVEIVEARTPLVPRRAIPSGIHFPTEPSAAVP